MYSAVDGVRRTAKRLACTGPRTARAQHYAHPVHIVRFSLRAQTHELSSSVTGPRLPERACNSIADGPKTCVH